MVTDEMTFTMLKPLAMNSLINNLTQSLGGVPKSELFNKMMNSSGKSPLNQGSVEMDTSTVGGSRPSSTKVGFGQIWGVAKRRVNESLSSEEMPLWENHSAEF